MSSVAASRGEGFDHFGESAFDKRYILKVVSPTGEKMYGGNPLS